MTSLDDYPHHAAIPTRWADNDVYGHVNNVEYYAFFDTVINAWLIREGGLDIHAGAVIGLCAESHCEFRAAWRSRRRWRPGCGWRISGGRACATRSACSARTAGCGDGWFVHVFVDRASRGPVDIPPPLRAALERLVPGPETAAG